MFLKKRLKISEDKIALILSKSYSKTKLGKFLSEGLAKVGENRQLSAKTGGTLNPYYKNSLAEFVLQEVQSGNILLEDLFQSEQIKKITRNLFDFIATSNDRENSLPPF